MRLRGKSPFDYSTPSGLGLGAPPSVGHLEALYRSPVLSIPHVRREWTPSHYPNKHRLTIGGSRENRGTGPSWDPHLSYR